MTISAGIVPVRKTNNGYLFLLLRAWNFWDFPKGRVESGEETINTAIRETEEEASIPANRLDFKWGKDSYTTEPYLKKKNKVGVYFLAETDKEDIVLPYSEEIGKPEHEEYRWVTYDDAQNLTNERIGAVLKWAYNKMLGK